MDKKGLRMIFLWYYWITAAPCLGNSVAFAKEPDSFQCTMQTREAGSAFIVILFPTGIMVLCRDVSYSLVPPSFVWFLAIHPDNDMPTVFFLNQWLLSCFSFLNKRTKWICRFFNGHYWKRFTKLGQLCCVLGKRRLCNTEFPDRKHPGIWMKLFTTTTVTKQTQR